MCKVFLTSDLHFGHDREFIWKARGFNSIEEMNETYVSRWNDTVCDEDDIYVELPLTISEAVLGCKKEVPTLYGAVTLTIPSGTQSDDKLRLKGKGVENVSSKRKGDMYVIAKVIIPEKLSKEQKKLFESLNKTDLDNSPEFKKYYKYLNK